MTTCNAQPYSKADWHWRLLVAHRFGHAAAVPAVHTALKLLDEHLGHCVSNAIQGGGEDADEKIREASDAIARLVRS